MNNIDYSALSDEELLNLIKQGNSEAMTYILNKYKGMVKGKARGLYLFGGESEDLIQEGMIGLFEAIQSFDHEKEASFSSFAGLCVTRQMYTAIRAAARKKHSPLNSYVPLDVQTQDEDVQHLLFSGSEPRLNVSSAEDLVIDRENAVSIEHKIYSGLSEMEKKVYDLYMDGVSYTEIAMALHQSQKSIDNALQRIKAKTRKLIYQ